MVKNDMEWLEMYGVNLTPTLFTLQFNSSRSNFLFLFKSYINFHICHYNIGVKMNTLTPKWSILTLVSSYINSCQSNSSHRSYFNPNAGVEINP